MYRSHEIGMFVEMKIAQYCTRETNTNLLGTTNRSVQTQPLPHVVRTDLFGHVTSNDASSTPITRGPHCPRFHTLVELGQTEH